MDKSWIWSNDKLSQEYTSGVEKFIEIARNHLDMNNKTRCPCIECVNHYSQDLDTVQRHLWFKGFSRHYMNWTYHGEDDENLNINNLDEAVSDVGEDDKGPDDNDDMIPALEDAIVHQGNNQDETTVEEAHHTGINHLKELFEEARKEIFPGCSKFSSLNITVKFMHLKMLNNSSNKSIDMLFEALGQLLPTGHNLPKSYYEAKRMLRGLGLGYEKIHVCINDCVLFWKEHKDATHCPTCKVPRYKMAGTKMTKIPQKKMFYFPITPRLQRLFMSRHTCDDMRWHKEKRVDTDGVLRHPADAVAWKEFDKDYPWFVQDPRNVRLGLATDGFNPFGDRSTRYSVWPVLLVPYNMPSWRCMKEMFFIMAILIPGDRSPGNDIDVYLQPLIEELKDLWKNGVKTYDASKDEYFTMHAAVSWTINDFPAYGTLSGWSTKGYFACPPCNEDKSSTGIRDKICYAGHRRYLPLDHPWRKDKRFDGKVEKRPPPKMFTGDDLLKQLEKVAKYIPGKKIKIDRKGKKIDAHGRKRKRVEHAKKTTSHDMPSNNWRRKCILWELEYWPKLKLRHNLDVMHIEKNICESIYGTILSIDRKSKDTDKGRRDLEDWNIRKELHIQK